MSHQRRPVVLIGPPGAGKSTVGRALAEQSSREFLDTDAMVEQTEGRTISEIFVDDGEPRFRELEAAAVLRALKESDGVIALGGGAPMQAVVQEALAGHQVVFLEVSIRDAARRVGFDQSRPLLAVNPRAQWTRLMGQRRPTYEHLATVTVETSGRTPEEIAQEIAQAMEALGD
ncbi:shikimate kinase [Demetria terragena]|uniref:shikimate kinase n=1 Tax=Demetria terragena TaxID=63959 RepID=UPI0003659FCC|nr:shikimate kinase [Demetria terragena]